LYEHDTIAAIATPAGQGGVAIIRVSGPQSETAARRLFVPTQPLEHLVSHHLYFGQFVDPFTRHVLDQGFLILMRAPRSYTGEHVAEIHCHGGMLLSQRVLASILGQGVRPALPGEFTKRAFLNGRMDLSQAEAVLDLIQAKSDQGLALAWEQFSGSLSATCASLRDRLLRLTAYVEAFIDFPEDEIPERAHAELNDDITLLLSDIDTLSATFSQGKVYREGLKTAIIGKPNVGKSTLLNLLAGTERAIVTAIPGTTRDILEETIVIGGVPLVVWDTAGLRHTTDEVERIGIERARTGLREAELVLAVFDASQPFDENDATVCEEIAAKKVIPILNKVDLPPAISSTHLEKHLHTGPVVNLSAQQGTGLAELQSRIQQTILGGNFSRLQEANGGAVVSRLRHRDALLKAQQSLEQANASLQGGLPLDLVAVDLRAALDYIGEITGHVSTEDILDQVFREFCIGK
jgi:tRNA modification GTPase